MHSRCRNLFLSPWPYNFIRIGLGMVFVWAAVGKLLNPRAFARIVSGYGLVPDTFLVSVAIVLPVLELLAGTGLVFDVPGSLKFVAGLLLMFLVVLGYANIGGLDVDCGCFSPEEIHGHNDLRNAFIRDIGLMGAVSYLFWWRKKGRLQESCETR